MTNWPALRAVASADVTEVKSRLSLEWVVSVAAGVALETAGDGRLVGRCPFHDDDDPSFDVFGDELRRCGCWACGFGRVNDVFDFIGWFWLGERPGTRVEFPKKLEKATELLRAFEHEGVHWRESPPPARREYAPDDLETAQQMLSASGYAQVVELMRARGMTDADPAWLAREFLLGAEGDALLIPHFSIERELTGAKTRRWPGPTFAKPGSRLEALYGAWRDASQPEVVVCEGESDTWRLTWEIKKAGLDRRYLVVGLPAGAAQQISNAWVEWVAGRVVTVCLDADAAGRTATARWLSRLGPGTRVAALDDGDDVGTAPDPLTRVRQAFAQQVALNLVTRQGDAYVATGSNAVLTNWALTLECAWFNSEGALVGFEGSLEPGGTSATLRISDLESTQALRRWTGARGLTWLGTIRDLEGLLNLLVVQVGSTRHGIEVRDLGLHGDTFVLPNVTVGPRRLRWDSGGAGGAIGDKCATAETGLRIRGDALRDALNRVLELREPAVSGPLVAWLCAAHLRALVRQFPALAVTGGSGHGKTTLIQLALAAFGYQTGFTVQDLTPYAIQRLVGGSIGVPLWFDEYRRDVRQDTVSALEGAIRAAWERQSGAKGGMRERWADLTELPASAPIIVTGEEALIEQSLTDRSVVLPLPPWRGHRAPTPAVIGPAFLWWLTVTAREGTLPARADANDRVSMSLNTLRWGWDVLRRFAFEEAALDVGTLDLSLVAGEPAARARTLAELEILEWGLTKRDRDGLSVVWLDEETGRLCVRTQELLNLVRKETDHRLPGGSRWFNGVLRDRYGAWETRVGRYRVYQLYPPAELGGSETVAELAEGEQPAGN